MALSTNTLKVNVGVVGCGKIVKHWFEFWISADSGNGVSCMLVLVQEWFQVVLQCGLCAVVCVHHTATVKGCWAKLCTPRLENY